MDLPGENLSEFDSICTGDRITDGGVCLSKSLFNPDFATILCVINYHGYVTWQLLKFNLLHKIY